MAIKVKNVKITKLSVKDDLNKLKKPWVSAKPNDKPTIGTRGPVADPLIAARKKAETDAADVIKSVMDDYTAQQTEFLDELDRVFDLIEELSTRATAPLKEFQKTSDEKSLAELHTASQEAEEAATDIQKMSADIYAKHSEFRVSLDVPKTIADFIGTAATKRLTDAYLKERKPMIDRFGSAGEKQKGMRTFATQVESCYHSASSLGKPIDPNDVRTRLKKVVVLTSQRLHDSVDAFSKAFKEAKLTDKDYQNEKMRLASNVAIYKKIKLNSEIAMNGYINLRDSFRDYAIPASLEKDMKEGRDEINQCVKYAQACKDSMDNYGIAFKKAQFQFENTK